MVPALPERRPGRQMDKSTKAHPVGGKSSAGDREQVRREGGALGGPHSLQGDIYAVTPRTRGARPAQVWEQCVAWRVGGAQVRRP